MGKLLKNLPLSQSEIEEALQYIRQEEIIEIEEDFYETVSNM